MTYNNIYEGVFISRPNRFIANVEIDGKKQVCHVKNTGRCKELLVPGAKVFVNKSDNPNRKTKYDLITVCKGERLINMDSQAPNKVFHEWLLKETYFKNVSLIKPETVFGHSRFDFYIEADNRKIFAEVKGVTLEEESVVMFPDAPTERGIKHINTLCSCVEQGYGGCIAFVIQMKGVKYFTPNVKTHSAFAEALKMAKSKGVDIICLDCNVEKDALEINDFVPLMI